MLLNYLHTLRSLNRNVLLYLAATCLIGFALDGGVFAVLFNLYLLRLNFGPEFIGQVAAAGLLAYSLAALAAGGLGERFGYRALMVLGLVMMSGGGFFLPLAEFLPGHWPEITIIALFTLLYIGMGLYYVNCVPYITSISSEAEHSRAFSMQTAILALAAFTGSLLGGFLPALFAHWLGFDLENAAAYRYPLMLASLALLPGIYILFRIQHVMTASHSEPTVTVTEIETTLGTSIETPVVAKSSPLGLYSPVIITLIMLAVVRFFQVSGVATANTFFNVYADTKLAVPTAQIGLIVAAARLLGVFAALSTPIVVARLGAPMTVLIAALVSAAFILPLAFASHWLVAGIGFIGVIALSSMRYPAYMIFSTAEVPPNWRGTMAGTGEFAGGVTFAVLAFAGGWIAENQGFATLFLIGGAMTLAGTVLFYFWFMLARNKRKGAANSVIKVSSEPLV